MSRIGRQPILIPQTVSVTLDGQVVRVKGPLGELKQSIFDGFRLEQKGDKLQVIKLKNDPLTIKRYGLLRSLINNMVIGVSQGYTKTLEIKGVGYKAQLNGQNLNLDLGLSHQLVFTPPPGITLKVEGHKIIVSGFDKQAVGEVSANLRALKKPEPYKGKGIRYQGEYVRRKVGKTAIKTQ